MTKHNIVRQQSFSDRLIELMNKYTNQNPAGSSVAANPLDSAVNPIPACVACRLPHSCPLIQILAG